MKSTLAPIFHFLYWVWFIYFFGYIVNEIYTLSRILIGEEIIFILISTLGLFFVGLFLFLFTLTFEIPSELNKRLRSASLILCVILLVVFFVVFRSNSDLRL